MRRLAGNTDGVIRVCTECNTGYHWLGPLLTAFQRKHPRVTVHVAADATDRPVDALLDGRIDLAILIDPSGIARLRLRPLFADEMVAIVAKGHPLARAPVGVRPPSSPPSTCSLYSSVPEESFPSGGCSARAASGRRASRSSC